MFRRPNFLTPLHLCLSLTMSGAQAGPTTLPTRPVSDPALDFVLGVAKPATPAPVQADPTPATRPASPFVSREDDGARAGTILLSRGEKIHGRIATTAGKPFRLWEEERKEYRDVPYALVKSAEAKVLWERDEKEWRFKESGSDIKEFSGKTYPARELEYTLTLVNGQTVHGGIVAPLYFLTRDGQTTFVLYKRQKGEVGQAFKDLVYVSKVEFDDDDVPASKK